MIVEFVGPPGAGKSTVALHLADVASTNGIRAARINLIGYHDLDGEPLTRKEIRRDRIASLLLQPRLALAAVSSALREGGGEGLSWMLNLCRRNRAAKTIRHREGFHILEEGPLNAVCLAVATRRSPWDFRRALSTIQEPDVVIALSVTTRVAVERIARRAGILSDRPETELRQLIDRYFRALDTLLTTIRVPVLAYDAESATPGFIARRILDDLAGVAEPWPPA